MFIINFIIIIIIVVNVSRETLCYLNDNAFCNLFLLNEVLICFIYDY